MLGWEVPLLGWPGYRTAEVLGDEATDSMDRPAHANLDDPPSRSSTYVLPDAKNMACQDNGTFILGKILAFQFAGEEISLSKMEESTI